MGLKPNGYYRVVLPREASGCIKVISSEGNGWYKVWRKASDYPPHETFINLNQIVEMSELSADAGKRNLGI